MNTRRIKGLCEECGLAYKGSISSDDTSFPFIKCPRCKQQTDNFDEEGRVDNNDALESIVLDYQESTLEIA